MPRDAIEGKLADALHTQHPHILYGVQVAGCVLVVAPYILQHQPIQPSLPPTNPSLNRPATQPSSTDTMADVELKDFPSLFSLKGKVAVVTGGSRGLGLHAASACAPPQTPA